MRKKFFVTLLAMVMILMAIPMTTAYAADDITVPTVFPNSTEEWVLTPITDGTFTTGKGAQFASQFTGATKSIFDDGNTVNLDHVTGMIFRVDATKSVLQWYFNVIRYADGTADQKMTAASAPYWWYDGSNFVAGTTGGTSWTANAASGYAYFDFSDLSFTGKELADIKIYNTSDNRVGTYSELYFVQTKAQAEAHPLVEVPEESIITGKNVTLTDDLALNVYANIPDGCTDATVKFEIGGKETVATLEDGRYSLKNLLPQQMGEEITATWTGTVDGNTVTETLTLTMADYCKEILADSTLSEWHELTKALLHYGAAAQAKVGMTDGLCNKDVAEVTNKVVLSDIASVKNNNAPDVWQGATLRLDNSFALKIRLTAPEGVTSVTATVDGAAAKTLDIVDGYVTLSLGASELSKKIVFSYGDVEKTLEITADHVLKNTVDPSFIDLAQAIANYANAAAAVAQ